MPSVQSAWMASVTSITSFFSVTCATLLFIRSATECHTFQKVPGSVDVVSCRRRSRSSAACVQTSAAHSSRRRTVAGRTSSVRSGFRKLVLLTVCFWSQLMALNALQLHVGNSPATSVNSEALVRASSATRQAATLPFMSPVHSRLVST